MRFLSTGKSRKNSLTEACRRTGKLQAGCRLSVDRDLSREEERIRQTFRNPGRDMHGYSRPNQMPELHIVNSCSHWNLPCSTCTDWATRIAPACKAISHCNTPRKYREVRVMHLKTRQIRRQEFLRRDRRLVHVEHPIDPQKRRTVGGVVVESVRCRVRARGIQSIEAKLWNDLSQLAPVRPQGSGIYPLRWPR